MQRQMELFSLSCFHSNVKSVWCVTASQPLQGQTEVWFLVASITLCFIPCLRLCYIVCSEWPNFMVFWCVTIFTLEFNRHGIHTIAPKQLRFKLLGNKLLILLIIYLGLSAEDIGWKNRQIFKCIIFEKIVF